MLMMRTNSEKLLLVMISEEFGRRKRTYKTSGIYLHLVLRTRISQNCNLLKEYHAKSAKKITICQCC